MILAALDDDPVKAAVLISIPWIDVLIASSDCAWMSKRCEISSKQRAISRVSDSTACSMFWRKRASRRVSDSVIRPPGGYADDPPGRVSDSVIRLRI
jgi:hypothetical protein